MKKVLFATTALIATAGMAAAEINFGGSARFGVIYDSTPTAADELAIHNRFTLNIDGSVETDTGIEFFARVRVRGGNTGTGTTSASGVSAPRVGLSVAGFTLATGNILGALESTPGLYDGAVGLTGLGWKNLPTNTLNDGYWGWDSFSSAGGGANGVEVIYSNAGFGGHLSWSGTGTDRTALNLSYNFGDWTVAAGYQDDSGAGDTWLLTAGGSFGNFGVGAAYADNPTTQKWRINGSASFGSGTTVTAFVADEDGAIKYDTTWGLGFTHSLGGAVLAGGVVGDEGGENQADLGVRFSF
ncbi:outer membrane protein OmpU [Shimia isoporae]|uniref:Outer membrane protein OmpU n=1 Tax=Shimia isoporae TaxID=647720 RepID=A0A4R1N4I3_9RHOB|nr:porin [Shimia isoporae]TCL00673.1 outer membrane protein OmpU [Shimia isoporae]